MKKQRVLMAMSGGIDSAVAAILLLKQGYELIGVTFQMYDIFTSHSNENKEETTSDSITKAKHIAKQLNIEHHSVDLRKEFRENIVNDFISEYLKGRTPNPCVLCNFSIKWEYLSKFADELNCHWIATGHYARISQKDKRYFLQKGRDENKDQSYFLWKLNQKHLARTLFPLGSLTKPEVHIIAQENGYTEISQQKESQEICFISNNNYRHFLEANVDNYNAICKEGDFINTEGLSIGKHQGYPNYTIGQRKGLQVAFGTPKYVCAIDPIKNTVTLGDKADLLATEMKVEHINFQKHSSLPPDFQAVVKIRYRNTGYKAHIKQLDNNTLHISFIEPVSAITPGQSAVIYEGDDIIAGGIIV